jgi:hypothetical protein
MSKRERNLLIVLGVIVLAAAGFFLFTMLGGEEPEEQAAPTPTASPPPLPAAPGTGVEEPEPQEPPRAVTFFGGRDPFVPLVVAEAGGGGTTPTEAEAATGGEPTTGGEVPVGDVPVEPVTDGAEEEEQPGITVSGRQVTLVDIVDENTAQVSVDGQTSEVDEGEEFDENFELVSVSGTCARFLFGDESFTLCQGEAPK